MSLSTPHRSVRRAARAAAALVAFAVLPAGGFAANLLVNPSFDTGMSGWSRVPATWPSCVQAAAGSQGWAGLTVSCGEPPVDAGWRQTVTVAGGRHYRLTYRVKAEALSGAADITLTFRGASGLLWKTEVQEVVGTQPWTTQTWEVKAPGSATALELCAGVVHGSEGVAGFDDLVLEEGSDPAPRELAVDLGTPTGTIRHLGQTNKGPISTGRDGVTIDFSERLHTAGITMIRQHDVHAAYDMHVIFPNPAADPALESSYSFATTDASIRQAMANGFEVMFRLGESYGEVKSPRMSAARWAEVVRHVVAHVNGDFASGLGAGVRYWEIWNEANGPLFWSGTTQEFYELFAAAARAVKEADPTARVGGPGIAGHTCEAWMRGLLRHVKANGAPLDFFSWHVYHMGNPVNMAAAQRQVRALLDAEGFADTQVLNTEWNLNGGQSCDAVGCSPYVTGAYNAAHVAAAVTYLQDTDIPMAFRYRTDGAGMFGMFGYATEPAWSRSGLAYALLAHLATTPVRVAATGGDEAGFTVLAGRSADGRLAHVLVADQGSPAAGYRLAVAGAPAQFTWWIQEIADRHECSPQACAPVTIAQGDEADWTGGVLTVPIASPAVHLLHLEASPRAVGQVRRRLPRVP